MKLFVFLILFLANASLYAQNRQPANSPTFALSGEVGLLSHYVHQGLSQTNKDPALQGSFWFNFGPQFRLGMWGSNVNFPGGSEHFNLKGLTDVRVDFSDLTHVILAYSFNKYYESSLRDGTTLSITFTYSDYQVIAEVQSNWEGQNKAANYYAFAINSNLGTWKWYNQVGYTMVQVPNYSNYFDFQTALNYPSGIMTYGISASANSAPGQFSGRGDLFFWISAVARF